ncbi:MAG: GNVR domain-containing protein, partial [Acidobacteriota bacterium]
MTSNEFKPLPALEVARAYAPPLNANAFNGSDEEPEEVRVPLSHYLWILRRYRWKILTFCAVVLFATLMVSLRLTPLYEATATIDIDRQTPSDVVGQDSVRSAPGDADQFLATQMKLVESDSVLRPVDRKFSLRKLEGQASADGSARSEAAPVMLKQLKVTRPPNTYLMLINYQSTDPQLASDAANAISQSYLEHTFTIRVNSSASMAGFMERQLEELKAKMERSGMALAAFERELNLVNPEEKTNIIASRLLQLNTDYTSAQSERLKREAANDSVKGGVLEAALATPQGESLRKLSERANEARERFAEIKAYYGANHPEYRRAQATLDQIQIAFDATRTDIVRRVEIEFKESERREQMAGEAVAAAKTEFDKINSRSFEYQSLKREADGDKTLYDELMRRIKEAGINAGFHNSAIRIADAARPPLKPVFPNIPLNLLLGFLFAGLIGIGGAVIADLLDKTIRDPEQVARTLRTEVIGSLPLMKGGGERRMLASNPGESDAAIHERESSGFAESVRTLRNSILLANVNHRYRSLLVTSAAPSEGKTTTAAHLAAAHAEQGQRTLLIDGDLRRGALREAFDIH